MGDEDDFGDGDILGDEDDMGDDDDELNDMFGNSGDEEDEGLFGNSEETKKTCPFPAVRMNRVAVWLSTSQTIMKMLKSPKRKKTLC